MGSGLMDGDSYQRAHEYSGHAIGGLILVILVFAVAFVAGWLVARLLAEAKRRQRREAIIATIDKLLQAALNASGDLGANAARNFALKVRDDLKGMWELSNLLGAKLSGIEGALGAKKPTTPPLDTAATVVITPGGAASSSAASGGGAASAAASSPEGGVSVTIPGRTTNQSAVQTMREKTVSEREVEVRTAIVAFETYWKTLDKHAAIKAAQKTLLG